MRKAAQTRAVVDRRPVIVVEAEIRLAGMESDAHAQGIGQRPTLAREGALYRARRGDSIACLREHCEPTVALAAWPDDTPVVLGDEVFDQCIVATKRGRHSLRLAQPRARTSFDVGKQEGDR